MEKLQIQSEDELKILREQRDNETLARMIDEARQIIPNLIVDGEVTYLNSSSGLLRIAKDSEGIYIIGQNVGQIVEQAEKIIQKLRKEFPNENFRLE